MALTLWHPRLRVGGMCHYLLPKRQRKDSEPLDGRFGEAVPAMISELERHGCKSRELVAHLYGGADTMSESAGTRFNVGERNIEQGWTLVEHRLHARSCHRRRQRAAHGDAGHGQRRRPVPPRQGVTNARRTRSEQQDRNAG
ncbi:MAG: chemotaxis protein CheD [Rubrivivax sp.]